MSETSDDRKGGKADIHTSYVGRFKPGSFKLEDGVASAVFVTAGGQEKTVKGYKDKAGLLETAAASADETILRGAILGGRVSSHLAVYGVGPETITGKVSNVRENFATYEKDGKQPYVNMFVMMEKGEHKIGRPVVAYGDDALALRGVAAGDRVTVPARPTHEQREVADKETGVKSSAWTETMRVTGPGTVVKAEPATEDSPAP